MPRPAARSGIFLLIFLSSIAVSAEQIVRLSSPDGKVEIRVTLGASIRYSIWYRQQQVVAASPISLTVDRSVLGRGSVIKKISRDSVRSVITPLYGKFDRLKDDYRELRIDFSQPFSLLVRAYDEGIAWRWVLSFPSTVTVNTEEVSFALKPAYSALLSVTPKLTSWELPYTSYSSVSQVPDSNNVIVPALFTDRGFRLVVAESDVRDYPGMFLKKGEGGFHGFWAAYPKRETPYRG
ncbi:glycoside hydrolase family 97 N-terminal domain-containing protein [Puia sp. P3]|uniref:glycoside hydrolase family 97 N-terminal domain-containing protein n=1 Tax=Puia sp. P3 TaxID=3423952 RepID=UPI003D67F1EA